MRALARIVKLAVTLIVLVIIAGILLYVFEQNKPDTFTNSVIEVADTLVEPFRDVFEFDDNKLEIAANFGLGALAWLVLGVVLATLLRRIARGG